MLAPLIAGALLLSGCASGGNQGEDASAEPLRIGMQMPSTLLPGNSFGLFANTAVGSLFSGLVEFDRETGAPIPLVAESIESEDQKVWHITVAEGWTFHNGETVTAESFARAWNAAVNPENAWVQASRFANIEGYDAVAPKEGEPTATELAGVVVDGEYELTVTLIEPDSQFPYLLGMPYYFPIPEVALEDLDAFAEMPIGNGPYQMDAAWTGGPEIHMSAYEDYKPGAPQNSGIEYKIYSGNDVAYTDYQAGEVDIVTLNPSEVEVARATAPGLIRLTAKDDWRNYLSLPTYLPGYDNPKIREALSMAIDRDAIIESLLNGDANIATDYDIPVSTGYRDDACQETCAYNPERAKQLWDEAGGIEGGLSITTVTGAGRDAWAESIAAQWSKAFGVEVPLEHIASENTWPGIKSKEVASPVALGAPANYPSPIDVLRGGYASDGTANGSFYANPAFDQLLRDAAMSPDLEEQNKIYAQAKDLLIEDTASILLWTYGTIYAVSDRAASYEPDPYNKGKYELLKLSDAA